MQKNSNNIKALINFSSKINSIILIHILKFDFQVQKTNIKAQKSNRLSLATDKIVIVAFRILNKLKHFRFFQKIFLLANININIIPRIFFLFFSNIHIAFID